MIEHVINIKFNFYNDNVITMIENFDEMLMRVQD